MTAVPVRTSPLGAEIEGVGDGGAQIVGGARIDGLGEGVGGGYGEAAAEPFRDLGLETVIPAPEVIAQQEALRRQNARLEDHPVEDVIGVGLRVLGAGGRVDEGAGYKLRRI